MRKIKSVILSIFVIIGICLTNVAKVKATGTEWGHPDPTNTDSNLYKYNATTIGAMPCLGSPKIAVFYVTFTNGEENCNLTKQQVEDLYFSPDYKVFDPDSMYYDNFNDSLRSFYYRSSKGNVDIQGDVYEYTSLNDASSYKSVEDIADEIFTQRTDIDWSEYDDNGDGYVDGVYFLARTLPGWSSANFVSEYNRNLGTKSVAKLSYIHSCYLTTIAHETMHMFGPVDIYAGVAVNPNGTTTNSIMDGNSGDIPAPMKYVLGWLDNSTTYIWNENIEFDLNATTTDNSTVIIYPNRNTSSKFVFFVEYIKKDSMNPDAGNNGGIRVWKCILNLDSNGNVITEINGEPVEPSTFTGGMISSPFDYLEAVHPDGETDYYLTDGDAITPYSNPSTSYSEECERHGSSCSLTNLAFSGVIIQVNSFEEGVANLNVRYENSPRTAVTNCTVTYYDKKTNGTWFTDNDKVIIGEINSSVELKLVDGSLSLISNGQSGTIPLEAVFDGTKVYLAIAKENIEYINAAGSYRLDISSLKTYYGGNINLSGGNYDAKNIAIPYTDVTSNDIYLNTTNSYSDTHYIDGTGTSVTRIYYNPNSGMFEMAFIALSDYSALTVTLQYPAALPRTTNTILDAFRVDDYYYLVTEDGISVYNFMGQAVGSHEFIGTQYVGDKKLIFADSASIYEAEFTTGQWEIKTIDNNYRDISYRVEAVKKVNNDEYIVVYTNREVYHYYKGVKTKILSNIKDIDYKIAVASESDDVMVAYHKDGDLCVIRVDKAGSIIDKMVLVEDFDLYNEFLDNFKLEVLNDKFLLSFTCVPSTNAIKYAGQFVLAYSLNGDLLKYYRFGDDTFAYQAEVFGVGNHKVLVCGNNRIDILTEVEADIEYGEAKIIETGSVNVGAYLRNLTSATPVTYYSTNETVATVTSSGYVIGHNIGRAIIHAYVNDVLFLEYVIDVGITAPERLLVSDNNGLLVDWVADPYSYGYYIERSADGINFEYLCSKKNTKERTYTDRNLNVGDTFYYRVCNYYQDGDILRRTYFTNAVSGTLINEINAFVITVTPSTSSSIISWEKPDGATGYQIYRGIDEDSLVLYKTITKGTTTSLTDSSLRCDKTYTYMVRYSYTENGSKVYSKFSNSVTARPLPKEVTDLKSTAINETSAKLTWTKVSYATGYVIYENNNGFLQRLGSTTVTNYVLNDLRIESSKSIVVKAYAKDETCLSKKGVTVSAKAKLTTPVVNAQMASIYAIQIGWDDKGENVVYTVYRSTSSTKNFKSIGSSATTNFLDSTAKFGTKYYYKVKATYASGNFKTSSSYSKVISSKLALSTPKITSVTEISPEELQIKLEKPIAFAEGYQLYRATSKNGTYKFVKTYENPNAIIDVVTPNKTYYYKVKAIKVVGKNTRASSLSSYKSGKATFVAPKLLTAYNVDYDHIHLEYLADPDADYCYVLRCTDPSFDLFDYSQEGLTSADDDYRLEIGKTYYYRVKSVYEMKNGNLLYSASSNTIKVVYNIAAPTITLANTPTGIRVQVSGSAEMDGYDVYRATSSSGKYTKVELNEFGIDTAVTKGKTYYYKVKARMTRNQVTYYSAYSKVKYLKCTKK